MIKGNQIRLKNRRVFLGQNENPANTDWYLGFKILVPENPKGKRVRDTRLILSMEAMAALVHLFANIPEKDTPLVYKFYEPELGKAYWKLENEDG